MIDTFSTNSSTYFILSIFIYLYSNFPLYFIYILLTYIHICIPILYYINVRLIEQTCHPVVGTGIGISGGGGEYYKRYCRGRGGIAEIRERGVGGFIFGKLTVIF